jgi:hypothetical protein
VTNNINVYVHEAVTRKFNIDTIAQLAISSFLTHKFWFNPRPEHVGFEVDKVTFGQVVLKYFTFFLLVLFSTTSLKNNPSIGGSYQLTVSFEINWSVF